MSNNIESLREDMHKAYQSSLKKPDIIHGQYVQVDGSEGTIFLPIWHFSLDIDGINLGESIDYTELSIENMEEIATAYQDHSKDNVSPFSITIHDGFLYRLATAKPTDRAEYKTAKSEREAIINILLEEF